MSGFMKLLSAGSKLATPAGAVGAGLQAIGGLAQTFSGLFGAKKRKREMEKMLAERPEYNIPKEAGEQMGAARNQLNARLDNQQDAKQALFTQQQNQLANVQRSSGSLEDMLAIGAASEGNMNEALIKNRISGAQEMDKRRSRYDQALVNMQEYRDQAFKLNELDPYKEKMAAMQQLKRDNRSMIFGGLGQAAGGLGNFGAATT